MTAAIADVSAAEFPARVLERSRSVPVVVDFWAEWCAPCRMLGPTLEREVSALNGRVELAKVDVDANQALAGEFEIQGIPAVKAFREGKVVAEFTGARDAGFVRRWLSDLAPSDAFRALEAATTEEALTALLSDPEVGDAAALKLAGAKLEANDAEGALKALAPVTLGRPLFAQAEALRQRATLALDAARFGGEEKARAALSANDGDLDARWALAAALVATGRHEEALEQYLELVRRSRAFKDDGARKAILGLFESLGAANPLVPMFRRRLQIVL